MHETHHCRLRLVTVALMLAGVLAWPAASRAQTVAGQARAAQATITGPLGTTTTTTLSDTGTLGGTNDERDTGVVTASVPSLLSGEVLNAATISWSDEVDSDASVENLGMTVAGVGISADSVVSRAFSKLGSGSSGSTTIDNLSINGISIFVTGDPNQTIAIPGGQVVINEQTTDPSGTITVNALHVTVTGVADVVIATAVAGIS
ncbi:MAG TPA: choice-of-anchor P family protein [Candidatus Acidoferrales bacterium]